MAPLGPVRVAALVVCGSYLRVTFLFYALVPCIALSWHWYRVSLARLLANALKAFLCALGIAFALTVFDSLYFGALHIELDGESIRFRYTGVS